MAHDNPYYYKEMFGCRENDDKFKQMFLGNWDVSPQPLSDERILQLASDIKKAEFVRIEETMAMAYEIMKVRRG